jgi:predicted aspartyl protease
MAPFTQSVTIHDEAGEAIGEVELWVDSSSTYTWLPATVLGQLGLQPTEARDFIFADGSQRTRPVAQVRISLGGPPFYTYCTFASEEEPVLLGGLALEEAGLAVDPINERLVPTAAYALNAGGGPGASNQS